MICKIEKVFIIMYKRGRGEQNASVCVCVFEVVDI